MQIYEKLYSDIPIELVSSLQGNMCSQNCGINNWDFVKKWYKGLLSENCWSNFLAPPLTLDYGIEINCIAYMIEGHKI